MREEGSANDDEDCHQETKEPSAPESKESVARKPEPDGWFQTYVMGPVVARSEALNPFIERKIPPKKSTPIFGVLLSVFVCVSGIFIFLDIQRNAPAAALAERELPEEFHRIPAPTPSCRQSSGSTFKGQNAYVQAVYETTLTFAEVRDHYDVELSSQGWKYFNESYWGRRIRRCYTKGVYEAHVDYEEGLFGGRTFSLGMTWGMQTCD